MIPILKKIKLKLNRGKVTLKPKTRPKGRVLLSYTTLPFIQPETISGHSNRWECQKIAEIFTQHGFIVDIIDATNKNFKPKKKYTYCIDISNNLDRLEKYLNPDCVKIFHIPAAHWLFQNTAEYQRLLGIKNRRGFILSPRRIEKPSLNIETADIATILGNDFTLNTYRYANKPITKIHIASTHTYPSPINKNFKTINKNFIWLGGSGMVHKGLDLVLEAFKDMPDFNLTICGKKDDDFATAYNQELFETPNIHYVGFLDLGSDDFKKISDQAIGLIFPSCSEGSSGGVVTSMHAGLIPIISYEAGVNVEDFGLILQENTIAEIKKQVLLLSQLPSEDLKTKAVKAWEYANTYHTRENFSTEYNNFVVNLIKK